MADRKAEHSFRNGMLIAVSAGLVVAFITWLVSELRTIAPSLLLWFSRQAQSFAFHLTSSILLPFWLPFWLVYLALACLAFVIILLWKLHPKSKTVRTQGPDQSTTLASLSNLQSGILRFLDESAPEPVPLGEVYRKFARVDLTKVRQALEDLVKYGVVVRASNVAGEDHYRSQD